MEKLVALKYLQEFPFNPFLEKGEEPSIIELVTSMTKTSQTFLKYMLHVKAFLDERFLFDIDDFVVFSGYKSSGAAFRALAELCTKGVIAKTKLQFVYWINRKVFFQEIEQEMKKKDKYPVKNS